VALPDFFIVGVPKAGTSALHAALARHPELFLSPTKEPKFYLCDGPPIRRGGPGDAHSYGEWIWDRRRYEAMFDTAPPGTMKGESTPFYFGSAEALTRICADVPHAKLIAVLRDPVDRAYSNWAHLWADGLEPEADFLSACADEPRRIAAGWAPMWRYIGSGRYGTQLERLYELFPREQVHLLRYRAVVDEPDRAIAEICTFLGVDPSIPCPVRASNVGTYVPDSGINRVLRTTIRSGAALGAHLPPQVWRKVSVPLLWALQRSPEHRPELEPAKRERLIEYFVEDVALLERLTGESFQDWLAPKGRGTYSVRKSWAPSRRVVS